MPRIFFQITLPIMRPSVISVAILQAMWIWNDFLLPYLTLDMRRFKTMSIAIQYLKGGYGSVDMGAMMGCLVLAIIPIIIFYLVCQKYIIKGVMLAPSRADDYKPKGGLPGLFREAPLRMRTGARP